MAKKNVPTETPVVETPAEKKRTGGRLIGIWKKDVFRRMPGAPDQEVADAINKIAQDTGHNYTVTAEMVAKWREPKRRRESSTDDKSEPTLTDLLRVKELVGDDLEGFRQQVAAVVELASQVGGMPTLKACLDALTKIRGD